MSFESENYWQPVCDVVHRFRCWARVASAEGVSPWGQLLTIPVPGYLEACRGPVRASTVNWVQLMPVTVRGGIAGRPLELVSIQDEVVSAIQDTKAIWNLSEQPWSVEGVFKDRSGTAIHVGNPFLSHA